MRKHNRRTSGKSQAETKKRSTRLETTTMENARDNIAPLTIYAWKINSTRHGRQTIWRPMFEQASKGTWSGCVHMHVFIRVCWCFYMRIYMYACAHQRWSGAGTASPYFLMKWSIMAVSISVSYRQVSGIPPFRPSLLFRASPWSSRAHICMYVHMYKCGSMNMRICVHMWNYVCVCMYVLCMYVTMCAYSCMCLMCVYKLCMYECKYHWCMYPVSTGIFPHSLPEWAFRARPGLWRICLCPKVAQIAEHKFGSRYGKVRANILFP